MVDLTGEGFYSGKYYGSDNLNPSSFQKAFFKLNASAAFRSPDDKWRFSLLGRNLTNENTILYSSDRTGGASIPLVRSDSRATVTRGREVALQLDVQF
jgi:outer membrane receptor protein involved in Fe transport